MFNLFNFFFIITTNTDRFAVLCNRYFSACDWRFNWCQFVAADVQENPGGGQLNIDGLTLSQL